MALYILGTIVMVGIWAFVLAVRFAYKDKFKNN